MSCFWYNRKRNWELHLGSLWEQQSRVVLPWFSICRPLSWIHKAVLILSGFFYIFRLPFSRNKSRSLEHCCLDKQMWLVDLLCVLLRSEDYLVKKMALRYWCFSTAVGSQPSHPGRVLNGPCWKLSLILEPLVPYKLLMGSTAPASSEQHRFWEVIKPISLYKCNMLWGRCD